MAIRYCHIRCTR